MFIDTHCHLYLPEFSDDIETVVQRADAVGVKKMFLPAINSDTHESLMKLENQFPGQCIAMMGLHPCYVKDDFKEELNIVYHLLKQRNFAAIGECGLDFYWDRTHLIQQYEALQQQIDWAVEFKLPIVLHTRDATIETIEVIEKNKKRGLTGIFHCFGGSFDEAQRIIDLGFYLGIGGVVTYKNSGLDRLIEKIPLEHLVLETDAPYLSPVPFRGKRNESRFLVQIAEKISSIKNISIGEVGRITSDNAKKVFNQF